MNELPFNRRDLLKLSGAGVIGTSALAQTSAAEEYDIFTEDFEDWGTGTVPDRFVLAGNSDQQVVDDYSSTGSHSYRMSGSHGGCWRAIMRRELFSDTEKPDSMLISGEFRRGDGTEGCHDDRSGWIGWRTVASSSWSTGSGTALLQFRPDGGITVAGETVGTYEPEEWVSFEVEYHWDQNAGEVEHVCRIDDSQPVTAVRDEHDDEGEMTALALRSDDYTVFFDDLSVRSVDPGPDPDPEPELTGRVYDPHENPASDTLVTIYDATVDATTVLAETTTDGDGRFSISEISDSVGNVVLTARDGDWFTTRGISNFGAQLPSEQDFTLDQQLLFGPEIAADGSNQLGVFSCWRHIVSPELQTVFIEIVNLAEDDPQYAITTDERDLTGGTFALTTLTDDLWINFGPQSDIDVERPMPNAVEIAAVDTNQTHTELEDWHPLRTDLPLYDFGRHIEDNFERYSTTAADAAARIDEGYGIIMDAVVSLVPGVSTVFNWIDAIDFGVGDRLDAEATLGDLSLNYPDPANPDDTVETPDPNEHTAANLAWDYTNQRPGRQEGAVVMKIPIEFQYEESRSTPVVVEAEWTHPAAHATFRKQIDLSRRANQS